MTRHQFLLPADLSQEEALAKAEAELKRLGRWPAELEEIKLVVADRFEWDSEGNMVCVPGGGEKYWSLIFVLKEGQ